MKNLYTFLFCLLVASALQAGFILSSRPAPSGGGGTPDYGNPGGSGDRRGSITISSNLTSNGNPINYMIDGSLADANGPWFASLPDGGYFEFDFGTARLITEVTFKYNTSVNFGDWQWQGWNGGAWVDIGAPVALGGTGGGSSPTQVITTLAANTTSYTKYRVIKVGAVGANWYWNEFIFKIL